MDAAGGGLGALPAAGEIADTAGRHRVSALKRAEIGSGAERQPLSEGRDGAAVDAVLGAGD